MGMALLLEVRGRSSRRMLRGRGGSGGGVPSREGWDDSAAEVCEVVVVEVSLGGGVGAASFGGGVGAPPRFVDSLMAPEALGAWTEASERGASKQQLWDCGSREEVVCAWARVSVGVRTFLFRMQLW
jgi:hypothetical protein